MALAWNLVHPPLLPVTPRAERELLAKEEPGTGVQGCFCHELSTNAAPGSICPSAGAVPVYPQAAPSSQNSCLFLCLTVTPWLSPPGDTTHTQSPPRCPPCTSRPRTATCGHGPIFPLAPHSVLLRPCRCSWFVWGAPAPVTGCTQGSPHGHSFPLLLRPSCGTPRLPLPSTQAVGQDCPARGERTFINMCLCLPLHGHCPRRVFLLRAPVRIHWQVHV